MNDVLKRLDVILRHASEKAVRSEADNVGSAIYRAMPEIVDELKNMIVAPETSSITKIQAVNLILGVWNHVTEIKLKKSALNIRRQALRVKKADVRKAVGQRRKEIDKILEAAEKGN